MMTAPTAATTTTTTDLQRNEYALSPALTSAPQALPIPAYLAADGNPSRVTNPMASAVVFFHPPPSGGGGGAHSTEPGPGPKLLLVRRAPSDFLPLRWELPGGSADAGEGGDVSVVAAAVRELWEETGLVATEVVRHVGAREFDEGATQRWRSDVFEVTARFELTASSSWPSSSYSDDEKREAPYDDDDDGRVVEEKKKKKEEGKTSNEERTRYPVVRLDPAEHVAHLWAGEDEVRAGWSGGVELVLTDPDWRRLMLRAFELHRMGCGC